MFSRKVEYTRVTVNTVLRSRKSYETVLYKRARTLFLYRYLFKFNYLEVLTSLGTLRIIWPRHVE